jgi:tetratricopeptide (TPR) repeat protein
MLDTIVSDLAVLYKNDDKDEQAEQMYKSVLEIRLKLPDGDKDPATLTCMNNLAFLYKSKGQLDLAEPLYLKACAIWEEKNGKEHPSTLESMNNSRLTLFEPKEIRSS